MTTHDDITRLLSDALSAFNSDLPVSPTILARKAMAVCDPDTESPEIVRFAAELHFRQMARGLLRTAYEETNDQQSEMFDKLQDRYPGTGDNAGVYVPLNQMTSEDFEHNIHRLRAEAAAKNAHADALRAKYAELKESGHFEAVA